LRKFVMLAGAAALLAGIVLLIRLPVSVWLRAALTFVWLAACIAEIGGLSQSSQRIKAIRLGVGVAEIINRQGRHESVQIMSGSVVLPRVAWLRLRCPDGLICGELLRGEPTSDQHWRRLQVLWRQGPGTFGARG
jgi:hypothetical protein